MGKVKKLWIICKRCGYKETVNKDKKRRMSVTQEDILVAKQYVKELKSKSTCNELETIEQALDMQIDILDCISDNICIDVQELTGLEQYLDHSDCKLEFCKGKITCKECKKNMLKLHDSQIKENERRRIQEELKQHIQNGVIKTENGSEKLFNILV